MDKQQLMDAINAELEDNRPNEERNALIELLTMVENESFLSFQQYSWLSYLCANYREAKIREELE